MMKQSRPHVSIVIPAFNEIVFLTACLDSVLGQSSDDWEAIVVDDASPDVDLESVVREFRDDRLRVIRHNTNRGQGAARNTGFRNARGSLVLPLDSDDLLLPEFVSSTAGQFSEFPETDCVFTDFRLFGETDETWQNTSDRTLRDMLLGQWIPGAGTMMRREVWERVHGYCEDRALVGNEDWDFWIAALATDLHVVHLPRPLYLYRRHGQSVSSRALRRVEYLQREQLYKRHQTLYDRYQVGDAFRATGYLNSAEFFWRLGERRRALGVAGTALRRRGVAWPFVTLTVRATQSSARTRVQRLRTRVAGS